MKKLIIIVDPQNDFVLETGSLSVAGAVADMDRLSEMLLSMEKGSFDIMVTSDMHPKTHSSFDTNGGPWTPHCVVGTSGCEIYEPLLNVIKTVTDRFEFLPKGENPDIEEYSAFCRNPSLDSKKLRGYNNFKHLLNIMGYDEVYVCGEAADFCVYSTIKDMMGYFENDLPFDLYVINDCTSFILDSNKESYTDLYNKGLKQICSTDIKQN